MVINPLGVKLSEAIMAFQENSDSFSTKVSGAHGDAVVDGFWAYVGWNIPN